MSSPGETSALVTAAQRGDREAFSLLTARYRREIEVHCYRMLGSVEDAEDAVQETLLRAWRKRDTFRARATFRAWLYGIATNACLDALRGRSRRLMPPDLAVAADPFAMPPPASEIPWIEPYPDRLLDEVVDEQLGPAETYIERETIELAFLVAIQHLPPRQRAVLILRDVLGWSARETAEMIGMSVIAGNSALQRGRETLKQQLPDRRLDWVQPRTPDASEELLLKRYMEAWKRADVDALVALLTEDARLAMPPTQAWYDGREAIRLFLAHNPIAPLDQRARKIFVPTRANRQPAFAVFLADASAPPRPLGLEVLRIDDGLIAEIDLFLQPRLLERFAVTAPT
jgi:RNA polymerase sigma-70 factor, ECF subfamily